MALRPQQQQQSWPESLAAMAAYPLHMNTGALLSVGGASDMGAAPAHAPTHVPAHVSAPAPSLSIGNMTVNGTVKKEERMGQWSYQETKDFIAIRSELERDFTHAKRNKTLWETIASKMKERGYQRTGEQCKLKWKNLYNRYKTAAVSQGLETCPFYEELHAIFSEPHRALDGLGTEPATAKSRKGALGERSSEDLSYEDDDDDDDSEEDNKVKRPSKKARKVDVRERARPNAEKCRANSMQEVLEEFFQQQQRMEMEWMEALHRREDDRRRREQEWRDAMEKLERERIAREQMWREREDQRRVREDMRAQKRDALFSALLSRLTKEE